MRVKRRRTSGLFAIAATALTMILPPEAHAAVSVAVQSGALQGETTKGVTRFLGVPFAAPPVGDLRWRPPQPAQPWRGVRPATAFGADCMQHSMSYTPGPGYVRPVSEDCLYLNIWRPASASTKPLPVMVWVYGGALIMGSGAWPNANGANLARQGVIVVTFNYRLGRFGFFAHPALAGLHPDEPMGDYGLMDQLAALRWVKQNIAAFGGDPRNVTLFGQSAGAYSVNALLTSPLAKGLFQKAISQSGGGQSSLGVMTEQSLPAAEAAGLAWSRSLGLGDRDATALRALPAATVLNAPADGDTGFIIDGTLLPTPVDQTFREGRQARLPYIVGADSQEQSLLQWLPHASDTALAALGDDRVAALKLYGGDGAGGDKDAAERLWADAVMVGPARFLARRMAAAGAPTWLYHYSYVPKSQRGKLTGAGHGAELGLVFSNERDTSYLGEGPADAEVGDAMSGYWTQFAKTGDPNGTGRPRWPMYDARTDQLLDFADDGMLVRAGMDEKRLDFLDREYLKRAGRVEK